MIARFLIKFYALFTQFLVTILSTVLRRRSSLLNCSDFCLWGMLKHNAETEDNASEGIQKVVFSFINRTSVCNG